MILVLMIVPCIDSIYIGWWITYFRWHLSFVVVKDLSCHLHSTSNIFNPSNLSKSVCLKQLF